MLPSEQELASRLEELWESPEVQDAAFPPGRDSYRGVEVPIYLVINRNGWALYWGKKGPVLKRLLEQATLVVRADFPAIADETVPDPGRIRFDNLAARILCLALGKRMKDLGEFAGFEDFDHPAHFEGYGEYD